LASRRCNGAAPVGSHLREKRAVCVVEALPQVERTTEMLNRRTGIARRQRGESRQPMHPRFPVDRTFVRGHFLDL
jgi:hypothetical protein